MKFIYFSSWAALLVLLLFYSCNPTTNRRANAVADTLAIKRLVDSGSANLWKLGAETADMDSAYRYFKKAEQVSIEKHSGRWLNEVHLFLGDYYYENNQDSLGNAYFMQTINKYHQAGEITLEAETWLRYSNTKSWDPNFTKQRLTYAQNAHALLKAHGYTLRAASALKQVADLHYQLRDIALAEAELLEVVRLYKSVKYKNLHYTYDLLSGISVINGRYHKALYYAQEMIKSMHETKDSASAGTFYLRLGDIHSRLGNYQESVNWWLKSYQNFYQDEHTVRYDIARSTVFAMIGANQAQRGLDFINQVIKTKPPKQSDDKRHVFLALAVCYQGLRQYRSAEAYFTKAIQQDRESVFKDALSSTINYYTGLYYVKTGQYNKALPFLKTVASLTRQFPGVSRVMDTEYLLFKIDSAAAKPYQAIRHFQIYNSIKDSIFNETKSKQIEELQIQYETNKKEQDIKILENHAALQEINLNITYAGIFLLLIVIAVLFNFYRIKNRRNLELQRQQVIINQKNSSLLHLVNEKEWLLKEVHHRVKNNLQIVQSLLNSQSAYLKDEQALLAIQKSKNRVQAISLIHQKLYQSEDVSVIDMNVYIQELCLYLRQSFETTNRILFELDIDELELEISQAVPVGLIINEAVTNAIKYAFPNDVEGIIKVAFQKDPAGAIRLEVSDNGIGIPEDFHQLSAKTFGVKLMRGLTEDLEGTLQIDGQQGTVVTLHFQIGAPYFAPIGDALNQTV
jgi:two-component sensor histidine kinase